jgi:predicted 3-demethylubiquinone-9 3-methyltransferase (glyoxalase superfamily)
MKIAPCLWFDSEAEEAAKFYCGIFKNSRIVEISHYTEAGIEIHGRQPGSVMAVAFELNGQPFSALNGGPMFKFNEAISLQIECDSQEEVDRYWQKLSAGGDPKAQQCGWVKDKYGLSWQVVPKVLFEMLQGKDRKRAARVLDAMLKMKKLDIKGLEAAYG